MDTNTILAILFNPFSCVAWIYLGMFLLSWWDERKKIVK